MIEPFAKRVLSSIEDVQAQLRAVLISGNCKDYPVYTKIAGEHRGLEVAAQIVREALSPHLDNGHPLKEHIDDRRRPQTS